MQETTALIIIEEAPVVEILENATLPEGIEESAASPVDVQATKEATPEDKTGPGAKAAMPTRKTAVRPKKALMT